MAETLPVFAAAVAIRTASVRRLRFAIRTGVQKLSTIFHVIVHFVGPQYFKNVRLALRSAFWTQQISLSQINIAYQKRFVKLNEHLILWTNKSEE